MKQFEHLSLLFRWSVVGRNGEDDDVSGINKEVEIEEVLDKSVPLVL